MLKEASGKIIDIAGENPFVHGCTVSKQLFHGMGYDISVFSLAEDTEISGEYYEYNKLWLFYQGSACYFDSEGSVINVNAGKCILTPVNIPVGIKSREGCVYLEIGLVKETNMNSIIKSAEVFKLGDLLPYQEGKIVNMDIIRDPKLKFVIMSFDEGTGLSEHAAPGEALVLALDGEATIGYEGKEYTIKAGETFKFDKMGRHYITAEKRFKMALLLVIE